MDAARVRDPANAGAPSRMMSIPRNGASVSVFCAHMLCREPATALLLFDPRVATAWLIDADDAPPNGLPMCRSHAKRFRAPVGWALSDQRSPVEEKPVAPAEPLAADSPPSVDAAAADSDEQDSPAEDDRAPTPLLSRAFRTTAQALI